MPVEIKIRCVGCHVPKSPAEFPIKHIATNVNTKKRRTVRDSYCRECLKRNPRAQRDEARDLRVPDR